MTPKKFYDWQTAGGTDDVMRLVDCLERADIRWCAIGGIAVNHWAAEPMVTQDVDIVVAAQEIERAVRLLEAAGFRSERFEWSVNFRGQSRISIQLSTEDFYREFPARSVAADIHGILMRVAAIEDTLDMKFNELLRLVREEAIFSSGFLQAGKADKADISRQLSRWTAEGKLIQLRRGLYMLAGDHARRAPHRFLIANRIQKGSYVSLQSALAFHSLIPEHVPVVTSVTTARPRLLKTEAGTYQFRHLHSDLFFGYQAGDPGDGSSAFLAFPEKALLDLIHLTPRSDDPSFLRELRLQNLESLDLKRLHEFARRSRRKKWLRAADLIQALAAEEEE